MNVKKIIGGVLLVFVLISLSVLAARQMSSEAGPPAETEVATQVDQIAPTSAADPTPPPQSEVSPTVAVEALETKPAAPAPEAPAVVPAVAKPEPEPAAAAEPAPEAKPKGKTIVYYFHTTARCATCYKIEEYTKEAVQTGFADELKSGRLEFLAFNVDEPEHQHFVKDYGLYTKSVVLSEVVDGKEVRSKNLGQVWELHQDKAAFIKYLTDEINAFLAGK